MTASAAVQSTATGRLRTALAHPLFRIGALLVGLWIVCAVAAPLLTPWDPLDVDPLNRLSPPSRAHWFGTDRLGRDLFSRVISGAREVLLVAPVASLLGTAAGTLLALLAGYRGGFIDEALNRVADAALAIPLLLLGLLTLTAVGPSRLAVIFVIAAIFSPLVMRTIRSGVIAEREKDYVQLALLRGESDLYIAVREILPNVFHLVVVEFTVRTGYAVFTSATLSFLGLGLQPPSSEWGVIVFEHYSFLTAGIWWPVVFPALAISSLIIGFNFLAEAIGHLSQE
uniref:ABC transporter permease n=1 Tax=Thermorudis peleae TaxID=1382356 RepID=A0A831TEE1_9BACT